MFWDQETWIYPPLLLFHPNLALHVLSSRKRTMSAARFIYEGLGLGKDNGLRYPWESAYTGQCATYSTRVDNSSMHGKLSTFLLSRMSLNKKAMYSR